MVFRTPGNGVPHPSLWVQPALRRDQSFTESMDFSIDFTRISDCAANFFAQQG